MIDRIIGRHGRFATALTGAIIAEILAVSVGLGHFSMAASRGWWMQLFTDSGLLHAGLRNYAIAALVPFAIALYQGRIDLAANVISRASSNDSHRLKSLVAHVAAFAFFIFLGSVVLRGQANGHSVSGAIVACWIGSGFLAIFLLFAAAMPRIVLSFDLVRVFVGTAPLLGLTIIALAVRSGTNSLWTRLSTVTMAAVASVTRLAFPDLRVVPEALLIGTSHFVLKIQAECSGIEGLGIAFAFTAVYLLFARDRLKFPQAFVLLPVAVLGSYAMNIVRLAVLLAIGETVSARVSMQFFHNFAGWFFFLVLAWSLVAVASRHSFLVRVGAPSNTAPHAGLGLAKPYLLPFVAALSATIISTADTGSGFEALYPIRVVAIAGALWLVRGQLPRVNLSFVAVATGIGVAAIWLLLTPNAGAAADYSWAAAGKMDAAHPLWTIFWVSSRLIGAIITAPLAEELAFRGFLLRRLQAVKFDSIPVGRVTVFSVCVTNVLFGILHSNILGGILAGLAFTAVLAWRHRLGDAIVAHMAANGAIAVAVAVTGNVGLW